MRHPIMRLATAFALCCGLSTAALSAAEKNEQAGRSDKASSLRTAAQVDRLLNEGIGKAGGKLAPPTSDSDYLRRVTLDLIGSTPSPRDLTSFRLESGADKRAKAVDRLLESDAFARNWARYWRDVIMTRATNQRARFGGRIFETWLVDQIKQNRGWDAVVTELITATGDIREKGETGLIYAHNADAKETASEVSRIFLGIQIQCANCHDHPSDVWKREQFHQLAAYFPRMAVRPVFDTERKRIRSFEVVSSEYGRRGGFDPAYLFARLDKNNDGKLSRDEVKGTRLERSFPFLLRRFDRDRDGMLSKTEFEQTQRARFRGRKPRGVEYYMPDLKNPSSRGTAMEPVFFVGSIKSPAGLNDLDRRKELAKRLTAKENKWFARAFVNRVWAEMLGEGFYTPVDDLGPTRKARFGNVLDLLADGFTTSGYDVKWLIRTVALTEAYQRQVRAKGPADTGLPFASASPTRLRGDQIYDSLTQALGVNSLAGNRFGFGRRRRGGGGGAMRYRGFGERFLVTNLFNFDPSTPQADIVGTVPQALFMMNSPAINGNLRGDGRTQLARILRENSDDQAALTALYTAVLTRKPSQKELTICGKYIKKVGNRREAFEDILWSLLNSSEFLTKR